MVDWVDLYGLGGLYGLGLYGITGGKAPSARTSFSPDVCGVWLWLKCSLYVDKLGPSLTFERGWMAADAPDVSGQLGG